MTGEYGILHPARVVSIDAASGGCILRAVSLARGSRWGPVPTLAAVRPGDQVIVGALGTSRDALVVLGRVGGPLPPGIGDIAGLAEALAAKADVSALGELAEDVDELDSAMSSFDERIAALESAVSAVVPDAALYGDLLASVPRYASTSPGPLADSTAVMSMSRADAETTFSQVRLSCATAGDAGESPNVQVGVYAGLDRSALPLVASASAPMLLSVSGVRQVSLGSSRTVQAGEFVAVAVIATGYTAAPTLGATPTTVHAALLGGLGVTTSAALPDTSTLPVTMDPSTWLRGRQMMWWALSI